MHGYLSQHGHTGHTVYIGTSTDPVLQDVHQVDDAGGNEYAEHKGCQQHDHGAGRYLAGQDGFIEHLGTVGRSSQLQCILLSLLKQHEKKACLDLLLAGELHELALLRGHHADAATVYVCLVTGIAALDAEPLLHAAYGGIDILTQAGYLLIETDHGGVVVGHALGEALPLEHKPVILAGGGCQVGVFEPDVGRNGFILIFGIIHIIAQRIHHAELGLHLHELLLILAAHLHVALQVDLQVAQSGALLVGLHILLGFRQFPVNDGNTFVDERLGVERFHLVVFDGLVVVDLHQHIQEIPSLLRIGGVDGEIEHGGLLGGLLHRKVSPVLADDGIGVLDDNHHLGAAWHNAGTRGEAEASQRGVELCGQSGEDGIELMASEEARHGDRALSGIGDHRKGDI